MIYIHVDSLFIVCVLCFVPHKRWKCTLTFLYLLIWPFVHPFVWKSLFYLCSNQIICALTLLSNSNISRQLFQCPFINWSFNITIIGWHICTHACAFILRKFRIQIICTWCSEHLTFELKANNANIVLPIFYYCNYFVFILFLKHKSIEQYVCSHGSSQYVNVKFAFVERHWLEIENHRLKLKLVKDHTVTDVEIVRVFDQNLKIVENTEWAKCRLE